MKMAPVSHSSAPLSFDDIPNHPSTVAMSA
jgi:hypothetical protein